jgi:cation diffusion facilitator family transporter
VNVQRRKEAVAILSVISNSALVALKLTVGLLIGSVSVISEAIHSGMDLVAAIIALFAVNRAGRPADADHQFGHGKIENISGAVEALLIFAAAGWILYEAVQKLLHPHPVGAMGWGIGVMLVSALVNLAVSSALFRVGRETESIALQADAWHLRTDVYTSAGVMCGLAGIWLGQAVWGVNLAWLDPLAAIAVALLITRAAYDLLIASARDLLDVSLPPEEEAWIRHYIARLRPTVRGFHHLRTRKAGATRFIDFHLNVEREMSVEDSHRLSEVIACDIEERFPGSSVTVHIEPCDGHCRPTCAGGCLLSEEERRMLQE